MNKIKKYLLLITLIIMTVILSMTVIFAEDTEECDHSYTCIESVNPTCYSEGYYKWECTVCGHTYVDDFWKDDHDFSVEEVYQEATCTTDAILKRSCVYGCGEYELVEKYDSKLRHRAGTFEILVNSTCTKQGKKLFRCAYCDYTEEQTISVQDHNYETEMLVLPTKTTDGMKNYTCTVCGNEYNETVTINDIIAADVFKDVKEEAWYCDAITFCFREGYVSGVSDDRFAPSQKLTRAQFVMLLAQLDGVKLDQYKNKNSGFSDVKTGQWYHGAVTWAAQNGYASGTGGGKFSPNSDVTREQLARFFYVYAQKKGGDVSQRADLGGFADADKVSSWALDPIKWAVSKKIINGTDTVTLSPRTTATRAQASQMMKVFSKTVKYTGVFDAMVDYVKTNGKGDIAEYYYVTYKDNEYSSATYDRKAETILFRRMVDKSSTYYEFEFKMDRVREEYDFIYYYQSRSEDISVHGTVSAEGLTAKYVDNPAEEAHSLLMADKAYEELMLMIDQMLSDTVYTRADLFAVK